MRRVTQRCALVVTLAALAATTLPAGNAAVRQKAKATDDELGAAVSAGFGPTVEVITDTKPYYLLGDFNGDGNQDVAVVVSAVRGRFELSKRGVQYVDVDPASKTNGSRLDPTKDMDVGCFGIALVHGTATGWDSPAEGDTYFFYECFAPFRLVRKGGTIRRERGAEGPPPELKGDAIMLDLENGGRTLIYWDGSTYRGYNARGGD
jgi:hypothetical protein